MEKINIKGDSNDNYGSGEQTKSTLTLLRNDREKAATESSASQLISVAYK